MPAAVYAPTINLAQNVVPQGPRRRIDKALNDLARLGYSITERTQVTVLDNEKKPVEFLLTVTGGAVAIALTTMNQQWIRVASTKRNDRIAICRNTRGEFTEYEHAFAAGVYLVYEGFEAGFRRVIIFIDN